MKDIFAALNPVHMDHLERKTAIQDFEREKIKEAFETARKAELSTETEAKLNTKLQIVELPDNSAKPIPGIIYEFGGPDQVSFPFSKDQELFDSIIDDVFCKDILDDDKKRLNPIVLEITPPCDYSQRKNRMVRFVGGLWVPQEMEHYVKKRAIFLKNIGPFYVKVQDREDSYHLVLDSHFLFGFKDDECKWKANYCLRSQILTDVLAWFASHAARPGYIWISS